MILKLNKRRLCMKESDLQNKKIRAYIGKTDKNSISTIFDEKLNKINNTNHTSTQKGSDSNDNNEC